jgi:hypothetical protein
MLAAGLKSGLTSQSRQWFSLTLFEPELMEYERVKAWLHDTTDALHGIMGRSNLYDEITSVYKDEGIFGTACLFVEADEEDVIRCRSFTAGQYAIGQDGKQRVNRFSRRLAMTAQGLADEYGEAALPRSIIEDLRNRARGLGGGDRTLFEVRQLIEPNSDYVPDAPGQRGMMYRGLHWLAGESGGSGGMMDPEFLRIEGFSEFPVMIPRWRVVGDDLYGSEHPGEMGLDDAASIQSIYRDIMRALELMVKPCMVGPDVFENGKVDLRAGALTLYDPMMNPGGPPQIAPLFNVAFDFRGAIDALNWIYEGLKDTFFTSLFRMWSSDMKQGRTATEIEAREREKMYALEPVLNRIMYDLLDPLVLRIYNIADRRNLLPEKPPELMGRPFRIEYTSILARISQQSKQGGLETLLNFAGQIAQLQSMTGESPDIPRKIDFETVLEWVAEMFAVNGAVFGKDRMEAIRAAIRQQMQQQQAQQMVMQAAQAAPQVAGAAKDLGQTPVGEGNALEALMGTAQGTGPLDPLMYGGV